MEKLDMVVKNTIDNATYYTSKNLKEVIDYKISHCYTDDAVEYSITVSDSTINLLLQSGFKFCTNLHQWCIYMSYTYEDGSVLVLRLPQVVQAVKGNIWDGFSIIIIESSPESFFSFTNERNHCKRFSSEEDLLKYLELK